MADRPDKRGEGSGGSATGGKPASAPPAGGLLSKTPVLLGGVMLMEAVVLFAGFKFLGSKPAPAAAIELAAEGDGHTKGDQKGKTAEVQVVEFKALNRASGRTFLYDVSIYVVVKSEQEQRLKDIFKDKKALIEDRIRTIIAESDPEKLGGGAEPGLETLRRQVKYHLDEIVGDGVIDEVLVPRCIPFRTDY